MIETRCCLIAVLASALVAAPAGAIEFPGTRPGAATGRAEGSRFVLENAVLSATWQFDNGIPVRQTLVDRITGRQLQFGPIDPFRVTLADGTVLRASQFRVIAEPELVRAAAEPNSVRTDSRTAGWRLAAKFRSPHGRLCAEWSAILRDGANYIVHQLTLTAADKPVPVASVVLLEMKLPQARAVGSVAGSPVVAGNWFLACEHPLADNRVAEGRVVCTSPCFRSVEPSQSWTGTAAIGLVPEGQLRRGFLYYLERRRARPYGLFLHYNSWWDIATGGKQMTEEECLAVIECFGRELVEKRHVPIDSFVFDDGWDDPQTLWGFHSGFPHGFAPLQAAAAKYHSAIGTWLSPWGGYGAAKEARLRYGATQGFETNSRGFSLAGPRYYARFRDVCLEMIDKYGVNYFKFDGIGSAVAGSARGAQGEFAADVDALLRLTKQLRAARPDIYLSITTGTWPSPYWLWYGDSVWRNGHDCGLAGTGSKRRQWITYRDATVRRMIVDRAPLYPLNSLMTVTVTYARLGLVARLGVDAAASPSVEELAEEIRMAFGSGTQLLELYVTPQLMPQRGWDVLAECARWARDNADVLVDVHWVGGDPGKGAIYGYAAWSPRKAILVLRNPSPSAGNLTIDLETALELPVGAARNFTFNRRWTESGAGTAWPKRLAANTPYTFRLAPFEVMVLEAVPTE